MCGKKAICRALVLTGMMVLVFLGRASGATEEPQILNHLPQPEIPQPQFFCGYCHVLTYPGIVQKSYETWKESKHNKAFCVRCHYPPRGDGKPVQSPWESKEAKSRHIPKKPPERFAFLELGGETVKRKPKITDANCLAGDCHGKADDKFRTKRIAFTKKVSFIHKPHLEKKNQIEGQQIGCTTCHQHETELKHFEVSQATCRLCHFKNAKFNEGRARCELCHQLPKKPIQTSGDNPITHQMVKSANVPCGSCHYELIRASGGGEFQVSVEKGELKTALLLGAGRVKNENCLACHDQVLELKEAGKMKLMHSKHVEKKAARCFDCHEPITHAKADLKGSKKEGGAKPDLYDFMPYRCEACHVNSHRLQRLLIRGPRRGEVPETLDFMAKARANCLACHTEMTYRDGKGVMRASGKACIRCHTKDHGKMLKDWKTELKKEIEATKGVEKEAVEALSKARKKLKKDKLAEAQKMLREGRESLRIVEQGNGVHNKKYAMFLIDAALTSFEDLVDFVDEEAQ